MKAIYIPSFIRETWHNGYTSTTSLDVYNFHILSSHREIEEKFLRHRWINHHRSFVPRQGYAIKSNRDLRAFLARAAIPLVDTPEPMDKGLVHDTQPLVDPEFRRG